MELIDRECGIEDFAGAYLYTDIAELGDSDWIEIR